MIEHRRGRLNQAASAFEEALAVYRTTGDRQWTANTLDYLGDVECDRGNLPAGLSRYAEALALWQELKDGWGIADALVGFVDVAAMTGQAERAARLLGAAEALYQAAGVALPPYDRPNYERAMTTTRASLGDEVFASLRTEGRGLVIEEVIAEALVLVDEVTTKQC
jgi:tetratricopeptide (TPR) repeat protein